MSATAHKSILQEVKELGQSCVDIKGGWKPDGRNNCLLFALSWQGSNVLELFSAAKMYSHIKIQMTRRQPFEQGFFVWISWVGETKYMGRWQSGKIYCSSQTALAKLSHGLKTRCCAFAMHKNHPLSTSKRSHFCKSITLEKLRQIVLWTRRPHFFIPEAILKDFSFICSRGFGLISSVAT